MAHARCAFSFIPYGLLLTACSCTYCYTTNPLASAAIGNVTQILSVSTYGLLRSVELFLIFYISSGAF